MDEELGSCWKEIGALLRVQTPAIENIKSDETSSKDRAWAVLQKWRHQEGKYATVGKLVDVLEKKKKIRIAQKLLGKTLNRVNPPTCNHSKHQAYI